MGALYKSHSRGAGISSRFLVKKAVPGPWRYIVSVVDSIKDTGLDFDSFMTCTVGMGNSILFWHDDWANVGCLKDVFPALFLLEKHKGCMVADKATFNTPGNSIKWAWKSGPRTVQEIRELMDLTNLLEELCPGTGSDTWVWEGDQGSTFSTKSLRRLIEPLVLLSHPSDFIWLKQVP